MVHFGGKFIKQKLLGTPYLVGVGHLFGTRIWKDLGLDSLSRGVYNTKVVVNVPNSAQPQGQGIGLEGPTGPWKANVWLSRHTLVIILTLTTTYFFKKSFESSRVTQANLIHKGQCVCVFALYTNPNPWTDQDEIWQRGGPRGGEGS